MGEERSRHDPAHPGHREHRPRTKKNTRRWCKGKQGIEHVPEITVSRIFGGSTGCYRPASARTLSVAESLARPSYWDSAWRCRHQRSCANCGKVLEISLAWFQCPELPADLAAEVRTLLAAPVAT